MPTRYLVRQLTNLMTASAGATVPGCV